jgi:hypothetical protein
MIFYTKFYDLSLDDEPKEPHWEGKTDVFSLKETLFIRGDKFDESIQITSIGFDDDWQPDNTITIFGFLKQSNLYHRVKVELSSKYPKKTKNVNNYEQTEYIQQGLVDKM